MAATLDDSMEELLDSQRAIKEFADKQPRCVVCDIDIRTGVRHESLEGCIIAQKQRIDLLRHQNERQRWRV